MKIGLRLSGCATALGLAALVCAVPATAEVTRSTANGFVTRHEVIVKATPKEVWLALISPAGWWQSAHTWSGDAKNLIARDTARSTILRSSPATRRWMSRCRSNPLTKANRVVSVTISPNCPAWAIGRA